MGPRPEWPHRVWGINISIKTICAGIGVPAPLGGLAAIGTAATTSTNGRELAELRGRASVHGKRRRDRHNTRRQAIAASQKERS